MITFVRNIPFFSDRVRIFGVEMIRSMEGCQSKPPYDLNIPVKVGARLDCVELVLVLIFDFQGRF